MCLLAASGICVLAERRPGHAQSPQRMRRIGILSDMASDDPEMKARAAAFAQTLESRGWIGGSTLALDYRSFGGDTDRLRAQVTELSRSSDVILSISGPALAALQRARVTAPIVFMNIAEPVGSGFVATLAHPGGNVTGFSVNEPDIGGKRLQLLKELAPKVERVAVIVQADRTAQLLMRDSVLAAAPALGLGVTTLAVHDLDELAGAIDAFAREPNGGVIVQPNPVASFNRAAIAEMMARRELPAMYAYPFYSRIGGLISYGVDTVEQSREAAAYCDRILRGEKPGELPVQQPARFELVVNRRTARTLGLDVPATLLATADEVIE